MWMLMKVTISICSDSLGYCLFRLRWFQSGQRWHTKLAGVLDPPVVPGMAWEPVHSLASHLSLWHRRGRVPWLHASFARRFQHNGYSRTNHRCVHSVRDHQYKGLWMCIMHSTTVESEKQSLFTHGQQPKQMPVQCKSWRCHWQRR